MPQAQPTQIKQAHYFVVCGHRQVGGRGALPTDEPHVCHLVHVAHQLAGQRQPGRGQRRLVRDAQEQQARVRSRRQQAPAAGQQRQVCDLARGHGRTAARHRAAALHRVLVHARACRSAPHLDLALLTRRGEEHCAAARLRAGERATRGQRHQPLHRLVHGDGVRLLGGSAQVPHPHHLVARAAQQPPPVRGQRQRGDGREVGLVRGHAPPLYQVPHAHLSIVRPAEQL
eukprot:CAMPEP_0202879362 /NCGR_PEP_ID=MMETSP1391-20130828/33484_1 /ASSEMBLY_ACC=CAM_ASM_000867 /TAXON_ID=1034604 /ORGANISM="Chlamydomonas leiostraca, Strain SAG 11-49" /LENGTH=228 /DNA_ID=CAMNT_0049561691 /DNA_START=118 /DNA_END=802 /DNA_ORIENTATION=+